LSSYLIVPDCDLINSENDFADANTLMQMDLSGFQLGTMCWAPCVEDVSVVKKTEITAWQGNLLLLLLFSGLSAFNFWCNREMVLVHCFPIAGHELP